MQLGIRGHGIRGRISDAVVRALQTKPEPQTTDVLPTHALFAIGRGLHTGYLDNLHVDASGVIRIEGWCKDQVPTDAYPQVRAEQQALPLLQHYRFWRPDVLPDEGSAVSQTGVAWEFLLPDDARLPEQELTLAAAGWTMPLRYRVDFIHPHYATLFDTEQVMHRHHIYGSGPPNRVIHSEVWELATRMPSPILDFGCGRGTLLSRLTELGKDAYGIELDSPYMRGELVPAVADRITLYDGALPTAFKTKQFRSVICSEVLEHIPDYEAAVAEIARLASDTVVFTVPDASAIPLGFKHGVVPWHLLEGTHVNFFNQRSLGTLLKRHFANVEFGRAGLSKVNDTPFYVSVTAICRH